MVAMIFIIFLLFIIIRVSSHNPRNIAQDLLLNFDPLVHKIVIFPQTLAFLKYTMNYDLYLVCFTKNMFHKRLDYSIPGEVVYGVNTWNSIGET